MTEQQLRDVLSRVVPEPPDSVTDASPIVRSARVHRRARVVGVTGLAALLVVGTVVGVRAVGGDEEPDLVVDQPSIEMGDPYTAAPCPELDVEWPAATTADLGSVTAVRFCGRPFNGFPAANGAPDALISHIAEFRASVAEMPAADPGRCAAVDVMPTDSRLLLELSDGTTVGIPAGPCQDVELDGRALDASDVALAFVDALRTQRDAHDYTPTSTAAPLDCSSQSDVSPVAPGHETLVEAVVCSDSGATPTPLDTEALAALDGAWDKGTVLDGHGSSICEDAAAAATTIHARTDRGDTIVIAPGNDVGTCDVLTFTSWLVPMPVVRPPGQWLVMLPAYVLPISLAEVDAA